MKSADRIKNRWDVLEKAIGVENICSKFNAYSWYNDEDYKITKDEHWCGWFGSTFDFVTIFAKTQFAESRMTSIYKAFADNGYDVSVGFSHDKEPTLRIYYSIMSQDEIDKKAYNNLMHGGRMSD